MVNKNTQNNNGNNKQSKKRTDNRETISPALFRGTKNDAITKIDEIIQDKGRCMISYVYFAQAMSYRIYEERLTEIQRQYFKSLTQSHLIGIDGIAMQIFDRCGGQIRGPKRPWTTNMNGTDFMPYFLDTISQQRRVGAIIMTVYDTSIGKGPEWGPIIRKKFIERFPHIDIILFDFVPYQQRGEDSLIGQIDDILSEKREEYDDIIIINGRGGPLQEIRSAAQSGLREKYRCIVMNQGATLDFISGFEQRVPSRVVRLRVGETLWRICSQPRNIKKLMSMFSIVRYRHFVLKTLAKRLFSE